MAWFWAAISLIIFLSPPTAAEEVTFVAGTDCAASDRASPSAEDKSPPPRHETQPDLVFTGRTHHQRNIFFAPYGAYWRKMRRLCTVQLLSSATTNEFQPIRRAEMGEIVGLLRHEVENEETVDLIEERENWGNGWIVLGNINCLMVFGRKYVDRDLDEKLGFKVVIYETLREFSHS